jgi:hypothetical protein
VLAQYVTTLNQANKTRDTNLLTTIETDSSYQIDSEAYRWTSVTDPSNSKYTSLAVSHATFYIPRQSSGSP